MPWDLEKTDTFGGEANYSWVERAEVSDADSADKSNRQLTRLFKAKLGLTGVRGRTHWNGDFWEFRPYNWSVVAFATYRT